MRGIVLFFLLSGMLTACGERGAESNQDKQQKLQIITTIKPLQAIVTAISGDIADSFQLIPDYASPHDYSFRPSDIRKVKQADVIFRIDEQLEVMLNPVFENLAKNSKLVSLAEVQGIYLLGVSGKSSESVNDSHDDHGSVDFHIWTSPKNTLVMANAVVQTLIQLDPENKTRYLENIQSFKQNLEIESIEISKALATRQNKPYIVFHDSWQYFATEFQLQKPVVVSLHEGLSSGAKTLTEIREKIATENIGCIFTSPDITSAQLKPLIENQQLATVEIDVLARKLETNKGTYISWLKDMGQKVSACLAN